MSLRIDEVQNGQTEEEKLTQEFYSLLIMHQNLIVKDSMTRTEDDSWVSRNERAQILKRARIEDLSTRLEEIDKRLSVKPQIGQPQLMQSNGDFVIEVPFTRLGNRRLLTLTTATLDRRTIKDIVESKLETAMAGISNYDNVLSSLSEYCCNELFDSLKPQIIMTVEPTVHRSTGQQTRGLHSGQRAETITRSRSPYFAKVLQTLEWLKGATSDFDAFERHKKFVTEEFLEAYENSPIPAQMLSLLKNLFKPEELNGKVVLDLGTGSGSPLLQFAKANGIGAKFYALDFNELALRKSLKKTRSGEFPEDVLHMLAFFPYTLPFRRRTVDYVFAINSLYHIGPDARRATIYVVDRMLKRGGKLVIMQSEPDELITKTLREFGYEIDGGRQILKWSDSEQELARRSKYVLVAKKLQHVGRHKEIEELLTKAYTEARGTAVTELMPQQIRVEPTRSYDIQLPDVDTSLDWYVKVFTGIQVANMALEDSAAARRMGWTGTTSRRLEELWFDRLYEKYMALAKDDVAFKNLLYKTVYQTLTNRE